MFGGFCFWEEWKAIVGRGVDILRRKSSRRDM
jgi:hypothetical protein